MLQNRIKTEQIIGTTWSDCFSSNESLCYIDISQNGFTWNEISLFADALNNNSTIKEFNLDGNQATTDIEGCIVKPDSSIDSD